jgi:hypothetical protein
LSDKGHVKRLGRGCVSGYRRQRKPNEAQHHEALPAAATPIHWRAPLVPFSQYFVQRALHIGSTA